jgi:hypothetical protein
LFFKHPKQGVKPPSFSRRVKPLGLTLA